MIIIFRFYSVFKFFMNIAVFIIPFMAYVFGKGVEK